MNDLKIYLANHGTGDPVGGVAVFGFDLTHAPRYTIPTEYYMGDKSIFGDYNPEDDFEFDHAMTIVGYDDNVAYDFDVEYDFDPVHIGETLPPSNYKWDPDANDGEGDWIEKPMSKWEVGAFKVANSHGENWGDEGFIYLPYRLVAQSKTNEVSAIVPVNDNTVTETQIVDLAYKINLTHEIRNEMEYSIGMALYPDGELGDLDDVYTKEFATSYEKMGGALPMQGVNSDPIEFGLDVTELYRDEFKSRGDNYYPQKYFFILDDDIDDPLSNEISSFELYDYRNENELHIRCSESNLEIHKGRTSMSIIYDVYENNADYQNNEQIIHLSDNIGFPNDCLLNNNRILSIADNSRLYFHNSEIRSYIDFGQDRPNIIIEGNAEFIGFDESTEDFINAIKTDFIINNILRLENCDVLLNDFSKLILSDNAKIIVSDGASLKIDYTSDVQFGIGASIIIEEGGTLVLGEKAHVTISEMGYLELRENSRLIAEDKSIIYVEDGGNLIASKAILEGVTSWYGIEVDEGSAINFSEVRITNALTAVYGSPKECLISNSTFENCADGIIVNKVLESNTLLNISNSTFTNVATAVSGSPSECIITNSTFVNCTNGINLVNCENYSISSNVLTGLKTGTGISLAVTNGDLWNNTIESFDYGIRFTSCSPIIKKNIIRKNKKFGILVFGHNAFPQLIQDTKIDGLNNTIINNGTVNTSTLPYPFIEAQIGIMPFGNIYMGGGMNNIYSDQTDTTPEIPCISVSPRAIEPPPVSLVPSEISIKASGNYWGSGSVTDDFFSLAFDYDIVFIPWYKAPFIDELGPPPSLSSHEPPSTENIILTNAMFLEGKENYTASIKQYEHVIDKYEDTPEYYVAMARLPHVYSIAGMSTDPLIMTYDEGLESDNTTHKKFFKEMKIATHIKGKKYSTAKLLAVEMKEEALTEDEITLAEIDIAICDMMLDSDSKGGKGTKSYMDKLNELLSKSYGDGNKTELTSITTEGFIPSQTIIHQNYPNPFNPTTEIKFALSTASDVKLSVYNINGQLVSELVNGNKEAGWHTVNFDGNNLNSGMYFYTLEANGMSISKKMILTK